MRVVVAGAGIVGVATAIWCQRAGHDVTLVDRDGPAAEASHGNAGVLAAGGVIPVTVPGLARRAPGMLLDRSSPLFLRWGYLPRLAGFLRAYLGHATEAHVRHYAGAMARLLGDAQAQHLDLARGTGAERFVHPHDYAFGYGSDAARRADEWGWGIRRDAGVRFEEVAGDAYDDPFWRGRFARVVVCRDHGRISDPGAYVAALFDHFRAEGGDFVRASVADVVLEDGRCTALETDAGRVGGDAVVIALGAWAAPLARKLGARALRFETERGYHVELVAPSAFPRDSMMVAEGKFAVNAMEGRIRCAGVVEFGGLRAPASRAPLTMLRRRIAALFPDLTWKEEREWLGHRPATADSLPLIGEASGAFLAFGHQHVGLTGGPKTGRIVAGMIGKEAGEDWSAFAPERHSGRKT
ncbi:D-amino acid dehydrogenase small subunit [Jannaschia aquimarina]|uniref:DadA_1 protein n=2 Tax=Jannaschia aquimarina TaxID=935700 RepID=A0A0D1ELQ8_9RHOB|nr:D-amino acid dehydrogenase small subunit [Jannaschia aquimarina]SNS55777.1 D-amino-acid dehydrogenase [Jannaschia aquimarina]